MTTTSHTTASPTMGRHSAGPAADILHGLSDQLTGRLVTPDDGEWAAARMPWNVVVDSRAYTGADLDRLRAVKAAVDPAGAIRGNVPIPLA